MSKLSLFKELGGYNTITGKTRIVCSDEFTGTYASLRDQNGGSWCRFENMGNHKAFTVKRNGNKRYSWKHTEDEEIIISQQINEYMSLNNLKFTNGNSIYLIGLYGPNNEKLMRPIRQDIREFLKIKSCVVCGTNSQIEIDHKNGLYNDERVLNSKTQTIDDFQPLCKHCNDQKRETINYSKRTGKRYPATNIPMMRRFGIDFVEGNDSYDPSDINAMVGTFWYDPVEFINSIKE